jgi:group I intron endonuclease
MKVFRAYLVTCLVTRRQYVGITSRSVAQRWIEHLHGAKKHAQRSALLSAILKYGPESFVTDEICCAKSWADICDIESLLIAEHGTFAPDGYNLTLGGEGRFGYSPSAESVERSAERHRGRPCHENTRAAAVRAHLGRAKTAEHRARISASRIGIPRSEETKWKIAKYWSARRALGEFATTRPYEHAKRQS